MKPARIVVVLLAVILALPGAHGQNANSKKQADTNDEQKPGAATGPETQPGTPVKIQAVISEYDGSKKISSLPYTLYTPTVRPPADRGGPPPPMNSMRYDVQTPIVTGEHGSTSYQGVSTDIDYGAYERRGGEYEVSLIISRSWVGLSSSDDNNSKAGSVSVGRPLMPRFRNSFSLVLRNGQTVEAASVTDPVTGHVLKVDVTLTALK